MALLALNGKFEPLRYITFVNLQWNRKYYECGDFSVLMPASEYSPDMAYLYWTDRPETGIVQKVEYEITPAGKKVQLSGFFLEHILNDKIIYPTFYAKTELANEARRAVNTYKADIPLLEVRPQPLPETVQSDSVTWQNTGGELGEVLYGKLETQQLSQFCRYVLEEGVILYDVWQGVDRTQEQFENNFVTFSVGWRDIQDAAAVQDSSNYKNYFVVAGSGEGADRIIEAVDMSGGGYKRQKFVDARDVVYDPEKQTLEEYRAGLRERGAEAALDYLSTLTIEATVQNTGFAYLKDYDLGDRCDIIIDDLHLSATARIIEVDEVIKNNQHKISITLGDKIVTSLMKARMRG